MSLYVWIRGTKLFGKVDELENGAYVATMFHHIFGVPLVFQGSYLVVRVQGQSMTGIRVPISWKSVLFAYIRTALFVPMLVGILTLALCFLDWSWGTLGFTVAAIATAAGGFVVSYMLGKASPARKTFLEEQLRKAAGRVGKPGPPSG